MEKPEQRADTGTEFVSAVLPSADVRELERLAEQAERSRSAELRVAVREHVERDGERADAKAAA